METKVGAPDDGGVAVAVTDSPEGMLQGVEGAGAGRVHGVGGAGHSQPV